MNRMKRELCFLSASDYWAEWSSAPLPMTLTRRPCSPSAVRLRFRAKCCRREPTYSSWQIHRPTGTSYRCSTRTRHICTDLSWQSQTTGSNLRVRQLSPSRSGLLDRPRLSRRGSLPRELWPRLRISEAEGNCVSQSKQHSSTIDAGRVRCEHNKTRRDR